ncbi:protein disulfide reductase [Pseudomonas nabeulensis]|uniref:Protein disulfide reductase n=1 Tax=Pseudomonas nabeulensis TaxID=2293833 RepID=A0A4Z0AQD3_9PSED|nr:substrate-binding domain-containing protein [Pseudomonas nabeulensis]TFY88577.1 protein disulfide reductase [Pseudomonas nabeulensis]
MFKRNVLAVSMTLAALCSAQAAFADVNGGGATLPQPLYQTAGVLTAGFAPYIGVGSGNGKAAFLNNDYTKFVAGVTNKNVHWAGSDSKLTQAELDAYAANKQAGWGKLIQVPSVATSVAIPFNKAGANAVDLSVNQLCGVFSGRLTDWSEITGSGRTGTITVVYRDESSGTTELFTRFLNAKCTEAKKFAVTTTFKDSYGFVQGVSAGTLPVGAVPAVTSQGVMTALNAAEGRVTYMSPDYAATTLAGLDDATKVAKVAGVSPAPANVSVAIAAVQVPSALNVTNQNAWVPTFAATASDTDPSVVAYPTSGYPILGFTNLIFSQCYANADQTAQVRTFFTRHYNLSAFSSNDTAIRNNRFVTLPNTWKTAINDNFLTASSPLSIGNPDVCNTIGRPL